MVEKRDEFVEAAVGEKLIVRQDWQRPELRILDAKEAQSGFNSGADYGFS